MMNKDYRAAVGPGDLYELIGAHQFCVMVKFGLRDHHRLLDFGCGSLRGGKYFINYLRKWNYVGIEPSVELVRAGIQQELTGGVMGLKLPRFFHWDDFFWADKLDDLLELKFDYVLAQSILTHTGSDLVTQIAEEAHKSLVHDGVFAATFFTSLSNSNAKGWLGNSVAGYTEDYMKAVMTEVGFVNVDIRNLGHPVGQTWMIASK